MAQIPERAPSAACITEVQVMNVFAVPRPVSYLLKLGICQQRRRLTTTIDGLAKDADAVAVEHHLIPGGRPHGDRVFDGVRGQEFERDRPF